ncbi:hypothetical protein MTR62_11295 [Novosphingobium sp. 1949]|uniref:Thymidylate kinase n=1 Tax=Novosphingobium organovorum TaxID=2930092 RepID=A0ABT0BEQ7_9SPHN|nr:hypothetical protein [Novosphingobium organovorum]MCJ2183271.1 hypothetical protein [Novosphingobium organovorum]
MSYHNFSRDFVSPDARDVASSPPIPEAHRNPETGSFRQGPAPCVALVGCDGSGKSTLARDLVSLLDRHSPTTSVYLGLGTGELGLRIARLPLIGRVAERFLSQKANKAHDNPEKRLPGLATALVMFAFSLARMRRFRKLVGLRALGVQVVTDRFPQAEIAGSFDGPGLVWTRKGSRAVEQLARWEHSLYEHMAAIRPTLVIRLNVDVDTAMNRKPDHKRALLEKKMGVIPKLTFGGAPIVDVDASRPYNEVLDTVLGVLGRYGMTA